MDNEAADLTRPAWAFPLNAFTKPSATIVGRSAYCGNWMNLRKYGSVLGSGRRERTWMRVEKARGCVVRERLRRDVASWPR